MTAAPRGKFLVVEGIDGSGSTSQAQALVKRLAGVGIDAVQTREPSTGPIGRLIREVLEGRAEASSPLTSDPLSSLWTPNWDCMAQLFAADRLDHVQRQVEPALAMGRWVVSDRYVLSSLAYQSLTSPGEEANLPWLRELNSHAPAPNLTLVLQVSAKTAAQRRAGRGGPAELYEKDTLQQRLAEAYARADALLPEQHVVVKIDAEQEFQHVHSEIWECVERRFALQA